MLCNVCPRDKLLCEMVIVIDVNFNVDEEVDQKS